MRISVISATSVIAQECIRSWAQQSQSEFVLIGRDSVKLEKLVRKLEAEFPKSRFQKIVGDIKNSKFIGQASSQLFQGKLDLALIAQGSLTSQPKASSNLSFLESELELNAISPALWAEAMAAGFAKQGFGKLAVIGSVAGDRGRAYNYSYGAAKSLLETYVEGLQQRLAKTSVTVSLVKPGPTATPMTSNHRGKFAKPEAVASVIVRGMEKGVRVIYAPKNWRIIMWAVRLIPFWIFKNLRF